MSFVGVMKFLKYASDFFSSIMFDELSRRDVNMKIMIKIEGMIYNK